MEEKDIKYELEDLRSIADGAVPPELSQNEAENIINFIENLIKGYKELEEQRDSLMWQRNTIDIPQIEALEEKINCINVEKDLLALQLKQEKLYGNKVTIDLQNGNLPDILVKDYIPKSKVRDKIEELQEEYIQLFELERKDGERETDCKIVIGEMEILEQLLQEGDK